MFSSDDGVRECHRGLHEAASLDQPDRIRSVQRTLDYRPDLTIDLDPYTVAVVEISASLRQDGQR